MLQSLGNPQVTFRLVMPLENFLRHLWPRCSFWKHCPGSIECVGKRIVIVRLVEMILEWKTRAWAVFFKFHRNFEIHAPEHRLSSSDFPTCSALRKFSTPPMTTLYLLKTSCRFHRMCRKTNCDRTTRRNYFRVKNTSLSRFVVNILVNIA